MKKLLLVLLFIVIMASLFIGCNNSENNGSNKQVQREAKVNDNSKSQSSNKKYIFKIGHGSTEGSALDYGFVEFKKIIEEETNENIKVEIYPNQQLGGDTELTESTQFGNTAIAAPSSAPIASFEKEFYALDIPFLFPDRETVYRVLDGNAGQQLLKTLDGVGLKGLGYWENGFRNLTNSKKSVTVPEDLSELKIRTMENDVHLAAWKLLGSNPTPMPFGELFTALQQTTVDGQENPLNLIYSQKFYEVQPYLSKTKHIYSPFVVFINKDLYESLTDNYKRIVEDAVKEVSVMQRKFVQKLDDEAEQAMRDYGVEITELTAEELKLFRNKVTPVYDMVKEKAGAEIVDMLINEVE